VAVIRGKNCNDNPVDHGFMGLTMAFDRPRAQKKVLQVARAGTMPSATVFHGARVQQWR
jgi:hypothetical protein